MQLSSNKSLVIKNILVAEKAYTAADFEQNIAWWTLETNAMMVKVNASLPSTEHDKDQEVIGSICTIYIKNHRRICSRCINYHCIVIIYNDKIHIEININLYMYFILLICYF